MEAMLNAMGSNAPPGAPPENKARRKRKLRRANVTLHLLPWTRRDAKASGIESIPIIQSSPIVIRKQARA